MIDDRLGIVATKHDTRLPQHQWLGLCRSMDVAAGETGELGYPTAHVRAIRIELGALGGGIKNPEVGRCISATPGSPLPAQRVGREIGIDERVPEPAGPFESGDP